MKIISRAEPEQILRNLYRKDATEKHAGQFRAADAKERSRLVTQIDREVEQRLKQQKITGL